VIDSWPNDILLRTEEIEVIETYLGRLIDEFITQIK